MSQLGLDPKRRRFLSRFARFSGALTLTCAAPPLLAAAPIEVRDVRIHQRAGVTRVVFDLSGPVHHSLFTLSDPERVVIDFSDARPAPTLRLAPSPPIDRLRYATHGTRGLRVVLDVSTAVRPRSHLLPPTGRHGDYELAIDLVPASMPATRARSTPEAVLRDVVVAIDPGHGGKDPGAIGRHGTREKDVVLNMAKDLAERVSVRPGMQPLLIRGGDYFVSLGRRVHKARAHRADLFISLHADASPYHYVKGSTVYVLSERGASSAAAHLLAKRQNASNRVGGVSLSDKDPLLAAVLVDLEQTATSLSSLALGRSLTDSIAEVVSLHSQEVEHAAFAVLKSPDIPSVLVETAFISNPTQERRLRTPGFQREMAEALMEGIDTYVRHHAPSGTRFSAQPPVGTG
jgi:N-acetylmuramoyl-L-alanine amidase